MRLHWRYRSRQGVGILQLDGYLGQDATDQLAEAVGWALARATGPILLDLAELQGWDAEGQAAVIAAAWRLAAYRSRLVICGLNGLPAPRLTANQVVPLTIHPDLPAALSALGPPAVA